MIVTKTIVSTEVIVILNFYKNVNLITILLRYLYFIESKTKRREPNQLQEFILLTTTGSECHFYQGPDSIE